MLAANREIAALIRDGAKVEFVYEHGCKQTKRVKFIEFDAPVQNTYTAATQIWIQGIGPAGRFRCPDILLFVNGIPLVFIELKNSNVNIQDAYTKNLTDYKVDIPQLFHANAVCTLSNAIERRIGSVRPLGSSSSSGCAPTMKRKRSTARRSLPIRTACRA